MAEPTNEESIARIAELEKQAGAKKAGKLEFRVGRKGGHTRLNYRDALKPRVCLQAFDCMLTCPFATRHIFFRRQLQCQAVAVRPLAAMAL